MHIRPILLKLHLWVALATGIILFILAGTGMVLVVGPMIDRARNPELLLVEPAAQRLSLDSRFFDLGGKPSVMRAIEP